MRKALSILIAAFFLLGCYAPVFAAEFDLYGSARVETFWTDNSEELGDDTQLSHELQSNSRIGATAEAGPVSGGFEYGTSGGDANIRQLYGSFGLGSGQLLVGKTYTPYGVGNFISCQVYGVDNNMLQFIGYTGRETMVRYSMGNFSVAFIEPSEVELNLYGSATGVTGNPEVQFPKVAARYSIAPQEGISLDMAGIVQSYELQNIDDERLTAWGLTGNVKFTMLDPMSFSFGGFYGQNADHYGQYPYYNAPDQSAVTNGVDEIEDTNSYGLLFVAGVQLDTVSLEAGAGYAASENDVWAEDDKAMTYYAQANIPIVENASITPEIGYRDYKEDSSGAEEGDELYAGLQWRVDF